METIASLLDPEFGKESGLLHEVLITARNLGATRDFFTKIAHDKEAFRRVLDAVYNGPTIHVKAEYNESLCDILRTYHIGYYGLIDQFTHVHFSSNELWVHFVGHPFKGQKLSPDAAIQYLKLRGYRPIRIEEAVLLSEAGFAHNEHQNFFILGTPIRLGLDVCWMRLTKQIEGQRRISIVNLSVVTEQLSGELYIPAIKIL